jgi:hypothetical protein
LEQLAADRAGSGADLQHDIVRTQRYGSHQCQSDLAGNSRRQPGAPIESLGLSVEAPDRVSARRLDQIG